MMTIDHMRVDHRITVIRAFTDAAGIGMHANETGIIRDMEWDQLRDEISIDIQRDAGVADAGGADAGRIRLTFSLKAHSGPRNGHMREFFEIGEYSPIPRAQPIRPDPAKREMIVPALKEQDQSDSHAWWRSTRNTEGPDHQEAAEKKMLAEINHIGVAASIAEMYAQRMRAFQAEGNEPRAIAAFKLADQWMSTYAGWATSGGEGEALSRERDEFHDGLVREFGYDPTIDNA